MKNNLFLVLATFIFFWLTSCTGPKQKGFVLTSSKTSADIFISPGEPECLNLAVKDLISDVEKISGKKLSLVTDMSKCSENCIIIGSSDRLVQDQLLKELAGDDLENLKGRWEAYIVKNYFKDRNYLLISGSDVRGTMFGIYDFIESYLNVDPLYYWKDREPKKQKTLVWPEVEILQDEPTFAYRGWFINDEDLLTEWMDSPGPRYINYPFYSQVADPKIIEKAVEAMLRLRYNLIIPASFVDIGNPPEKLLVDAAAKRGVFLSMHHIEPVGVSGFTFFNYWKAKNKEYKFSFYSNPREITEVWKAYAEMWVQYPNVVWQIGLRGIADRPMWHADPDIPESDSIRGKLISDAMKVQVDIIRSVDKREEIPITTTLWMEGSNLNKQGYLTFPEDVMVIFSDNSPGWIMQPDFYETVREPGRNYGIYYHHALWETGPHLVQGVSPAKTYDIFKQAVEYNSNYYAILNVSNIREFPLGLKASSDMLYNFNDFNPDIFLENWCKEHFGKAAKMAESAYRQFFESYQEHGERNVVFLLDGQMRIRGRGLISNLSKRIKEPQKYKKNTENFYDSRVGEITFKEFAEKLTIQKEGIQKAGELGEEVRNKLKGQSLSFFEVNFIAQQNILMGIINWLDALLKATKAEDMGNRDETVKALEEAVKAFELVHSGKALASRGEKWENWYRGDTKMNMDNVEKLTLELLELAKK